LEVLLCKIYTFLQHEQQLVAYTERLLFKGYGSLSWYDGVQLCPDGGTEFLGHSGDRGREEEEGEGGDDTVRVGDQGGGREGGEVAQEEDCLGRVGVDTLQHCVRTEKGDWVGGRDG
jgi:hypothetical protein